MMLKAVILVCLYGLVVDAFSLNSKLEALAKLKSGNSNSREGFLKHLSELKTRTKKNDSEPQSQNSERSFDGYNGYGNWNWDWFNGGQGNSWGWSQEMNNYYRYMPKFMYYLQDVVMMQNIFIEFQTNQYILNYQFGNDDNMYDMQENMRYMFQMSQNMYQTGKEYNWWEQYDNYRGYFGYNNFYNNGGRFNNWNNNGQEGFDGFNNFNNFNYNDKK